MIISFSSSKFFLLSKNSFSSSFFYNSLGVSVFLKFYSNRRFLQTSSGPNFDFSVINYDNFFDPSTSNDSTRLAARHLCFIKNFANEFGEVSGGYDELMSILTSNQEGRDWYALYKQQLSFYLETFQQYTGTGMTNDEIDSARKAYAKTSEARSKCSKAQNELFEEYQAKRKARNKVMLDEICRESHFGIVPLVRSDHLTMAQAIQIRRLKDPAEREKLEASLVLDLKKEIVEEIRNKGVYSKIERIIL